MAISIRELEHRFDVELPRPRLEGRPPEALLQAATRWSEAVWDAARAAGPIELGTDEIERGSDVGRRPLFVCGVHRSGTTLVRDLLDGHPALAMLPSEGTFLTNFQVQLRRLPREDRLPFLAREWLRRLVNPINQCPYFLLGRTDGEQSPYVLFARSVMAWWPVAEERFGRDTSSWPLVAVALAYAHGTGALSARSPCRRWGEKTPANERFLDCLQSEFPDARVIQVVRHPLSVYASRKKMEQRSGGSFRSVSRVLRDLDVSYRTAAEQLRRNAADRFLLIRYEDLIEDTHATIDRLAAFLDIEPLPILMRPTVAGISAASNSSFALDMVPGGIHAETGRGGAGTLTRADRDRLTAVVGNAAASLGYDLAPISSWRARLLRLAARIA